MLHTFAVYVDNKPGVLNRVASLFRRRAFNIESLTVGHTETRRHLAHDRRRRHRRVRRAAARGATSTSWCRCGASTTSPRAPSIARDLALIKVAATGDARTHVMQLVDVYRARIVDVSPESLVIETTGTEDKIDSLLEVLRPYGVIEMVRTGRVAMARGSGCRRSRAPRGRAVARDDRDVSGDVSELYLCNLATWSLEIRHCRPVTDSQMLRCTNCRSH